MTNLSGALREKLKQTCIYTCLEPVEVLTSKLDGTQKYLFRLTDGQVIESVLMKYHHGNSVCISTQVGCRMGCRFCASTIGGRIQGPDYRRDCWTRSTGFRSYPGSGFPIWY